MSKRVLITGAAGFIGAHLVEYILRHTDWTVVGLDRLDSAGSLRRLYSRPLWEQQRWRVSFVHHDLRAPISDHVSQELGMFDRVLHLAAASHVDRSLGDPNCFVLDNVVGTQNLLTWLRMYAPLNPGARCLHFSTDEVFGAAPPGVAFKPWDRHNPTNVYAATKAGAEALAVAFAYTWDLPMVVTHCTNVIGPTQHAEKFIPIAINKIARNEPVPIHTVGGVACSRFYVDVENVCAATLAILEKGTLLDGTERSGRYNISGDVELDNVEVCEQIAELLGMSLKTTIVERPPGRLKPDLRYCVDDSELRALGWKPHVPFQLSLSRTVWDYMLTRPTDA